MLRALFAVILLIASAQAAPQQERAAAERPRVVIETTKGAFTIELFPEVAPKTVENFLAYVDSGFYEDTIFHRVIRNFVVQGGGYTPELEPKPTLPPVELETKGGETNTRGTVAMARGHDAQSATSQFFINLADNEQLDRRGTSFGYTVFGRVVEGMEVVDRIAAVQTSRRGKFEDIPILPVIIGSARRVE